VGIGQGAIAATPIQMLRIIAGIASGGELKRPHVVPYDEMPPEFKQALEQNGGSGDAVVPITTDNWELITDAMTGTVGPGGTAASAHLNGIDFAGKTGSAQTVSHEGKAKGLGAKMRDNGWFVGLTPRRNPEIAVCVLWEGGMRGYLSARRAAMVIEAYVDKQRRLEDNLRQASVPASGGQGEMAGVWHDGGDDAEKAAGVKTVAQGQDGARLAPGDLHAGRFQMAKPGNEAAGKASGRGLGPGELSGPGKSATQAMVAATAKPLAKVPQVAER
jgi:penicillin-binding protein 2